MATSSIKNYAIKSDICVRQKPIGSGSSLTIDKCGCLIYLSYSNSEQAYGIFRIAGDNVYQLMGSQDSSVSVSVNATSIIINNGKAWTIPAIIIGV